jgi:hypothetical protein
MDGLHVNKERQHCYDWDTTILWALTWQLLVSMILDALKVGLELSNHTPTQINKLISPFSRLKDP